MVAEGVHLMAIKINRQLLLGLGGAVLVLSIFMDIYQYASIHRIEYTSHTSINGFSAPDKITWNGRT